MKFLRKTYMVTLAKVFWFTAKRLFEFCVIHEPNGKDATWMKPSFHFYHQQRDVLGFARAIIEHEEQRCQEESTQDSPTSSGP